MNEYVTLTEFTLLMMLAALVLAVVVKNFFGTRSAYDVDATVVQFAPIARAGTAAPISRPTFLKRGEESTEPFKFKISHPSESDASVEHGLHLAGVTNSAFIE